MPIPSKPFLSATPGITGLGFPIRYRPPRLTFRVYGILREMQPEQVYACRELDGMTGEWVMVVYGFGPPHSAHACYLRIPEDMGPGRHEFRGGQGLRAGCFLGRRSHFTTEYGGRGALMLLRQDEHCVEGHFSFTAGRLSPPYDLIAVREGYFCAPVR